jgi:hypothetical protein
MRGALAWLGGALGLAALLKFRRRRPAQPYTPPATEDPANELKRRLEEARGADDDRDDFDAAQGQPVDEVDPTRSIAERRQAVHEKAREALGEMRTSDDE